jgi:hypothetical protein
LSWTEVDKGVKEIINQIQHLKEKYGDMWYDEFINKITEFLKEMSVIINKFNKSEINSLIDELIEINNTKDFVNNEYYKYRSNKIREYIYKYYENKRTGQEKKTKIDRSKFVSTPIKTIILEEKKRIKENSIENLKINDRIEYDTGKIISEFFNVYNNLLGKNKVEKEKIESHKFKIKNSVNEDEKLKLNKPFTYEEINKIIGEMKSSSPGLNGLTIGFYKKYFVFFGEEYVKIINGIGKLPNQFMESFIKLIPKNKNEYKTTSDYRPITITNFDYRIMAKALVNRANEITDKIINNDQKCIGKNRRMSSIIILVRDIIWDAIQNKKSLAVATFDQSKAFDNIDHQYILKLLETLGLGEFFLRNISRMYDNSRTMVRVNGYNTDKIIIKSGIKQGCPMSMWLYAVSIEELLQQIRENNEIKGYNFKSYMLNEIKIKAYADDVDSITT